MKRLQSLIYPSLLFTMVSTAHAEVIVENSATSVEIDLSNESPNYKYQVTVSRPVTPKKMTGNPFRDSYLQVSCGGSVLDTDAQRITPTSFGKVMTFQVTFELSNQICKEFKLQTILETNGTVVESPRTFYEIVKIRETVPYFISQVRAEMPAAKQDFVYYHGEMSKALGNRISFHCLVKDYENDPNVSIIIDDFITEYKKLFGVEYKSPDIDCNDPPKLDKEIAVCSTNPNLRRNFCAFYKLYSQSIDFFRTSIAATKDMKNSLSAGEAPLAANLDALIKDLEDTEKEARALTQSQPQPAS